MDMSHKYRANYMHGQHGKPGTNLTAIKIKVGKKKLPVVVHKLAAPAFKGFLEGLVEVGCPITMIGGYVYRNIRGSKHLSQHAYGNAIDIDQTARNVVSQGLTQWMTVNEGMLNMLEQKWNMEGGQHWRNPDAGHWEWKGPMKKKGPDQA